jgi:hypothetical protein
MPAGAPASRPSSAYLGDTALSGHRAQDVADMVAGLSDASAAVNELSGLMNEAEAEVQRLSARMQAGPTRRTGLAQRIEREDLERDLTLARARARRLQEAMHDLQDTMEQLHQRHGASNELTELRARCQQDELRARAAQAELGELNDHEAQVGEAAAAMRLRQAQSLRQGQEGHSSGSHLHLSGLAGQAASHGEPPAGLRPELEQVSQGIAQVVQRTLRGERQAAGPGEPEVGHDVAQVQARWANAMRSDKMPRFADPADLVQWVIRQAHADGSLDIQTYAYKLRYSTQLKETIREELSRARQFRSDHAARLKDGEMDAAFDRVKISKDPVLGEDGVPRVREPQAAGEIRRVEEMDAYIADLQNMLASTGEDMQFAQLELQNMTQRQQQVMNVLSNLSKTLHETSMAIIRKIGT